MNYKSQTDQDHPPSSRPHLIRHPSKFLDLLDRTNITLMRLDPLSISLQLRVFGRVELVAGRDDGVRHQDVGGGQRGAAQVLAVVWGRGQLRLEEAEVRGEVVVQVEVVDFVGDAAGDGLDEEGDGGLADVCQDG